MVLTTGAWPDETEEGCGTIGMVHGIWSALPWNMVRSAMEYGPLCHGIWSALPWNMVRSQWRIQGGGGSKGSKDPPSARPVMNKLTYE